MKKKILDKIRQITQETETPGEIAPAVTAYNAYLRWPTVIDDQAKTPPKLLPWQPDLPEDQASLWKQVAVVAQRLGVDPDVYVWTLTREQHVYVPAADLPHLEQQFRSVYQRACENQLPVKYHMTTLNRLADKYMMAALKPGEELATQDMATKNEACMQALLYGRRKRHGIIQEGARELDLVFSWSFARHAKLDSIVARLRPFAGIELWVRREIYKHCDWAMFDVKPHLMAEAAEIYAATMR